MRFLLCCLPKLIPVLTTTLILCGAGWGAPARTAASGQASSAEVKGIDALTNKDVAASMKDDMDTLCSLWTDDGVLLLPGASPLVGKKAICDMLQQQRESAKGAMTTDYTEEWQEVRIFGNYAWQWGEMSQTRREASGKLDTMRVNAIRILRRDADGWKVARAAVTPAAP